MGEYDNEIRTVATIDHSLPNPHRSLLLEYRSRRAARPKNCIFSENVTTKM